jgi:hypothetical protein
MTWTLPSELDDIILDHLHDDPVTLSRCALVQRSWLPTARYHFWNHLSLNCTSDELTKLHTLITTISPAVGFHIRSVVVMQKKGEACQWYDLNLLHYTLSVLSLLPNLSNLTLDGLWFGAPKRVLRAGDQASEPTNALSLSVRKLTITTCSFDSFEDVQQLCLSFPALARLQLDGVWWGRWDGEFGSLGGVPGADISSPLQKIALREVDLGSCFSRDTVVNWLLGTTSPNTVETLRLPLIGTHDTRLKELLASVGGALRHIEIGSPSTSHSRVSSECDVKYKRGTYTDDILSDNAASDRSLESYLDLSPNTSLRTITLGVPTYRDPKFITTWLHSIISQVSSPYLAEVRFAIYPILRSDAADAENMLSSFGWSGLIEVIDRKVQFTGVRKVVFTAGRSTDYMQVPGAFIDLTPLLRKVVPTILNLSALRKSGIEVAFQSN